MTAMTQPPDPHAPGHGWPPAVPYPAPEHPKATTVLVLGILGLVLCQVIAPFAWVMGRSTVAEIDASGGRWGGRGSANAGYVLGIVGTAILGFAVLALLGYFMLMVVLFGGMATAGY